MPSTTLTRSLPQPGGGDEGGGSGAGFVVGGVVLVGGLPADGRPGHAEHPDPSRRPELISIQKKAVRRSPVTRREIPDCARHSS